MERPTHVRLCIKEISFFHVIETIFPASRGVANIVQTKFDAQTLHDKPAVAASSRMVDDGKGAKEVFRVDNFDLIQVCQFTS